MYEAIILAGGEAKRLKPHIWKDKPLVKINKDTLIDYQIKWLNHYGIKDIVIASNRKDLTSLPVKYSLEVNRLGTGGAVRKAIEIINNNIFYLLNVDDILLDFNPIALFDYADRGAGIVLAKPRLRYGKVDYSSTLNIVDRFIEKPILPFYVSTGHYVFKKYVAEKYFPKKGDLELDVMQRLADNKKLRACLYEGAWLTINNYKDLKSTRKLMKVRRLFNEL